MSNARTCTILFTDIVGSTELRAEVGDDDFDVARRRHDDLLAEAIQGHGGELVKFGGDGAMAVFDSAADALSCGVAIQQGVARNGRVGDTPLEVRVGVSAGDVAEEDGDFHGTPVVEASRLCEAAGGSTILAADVVRVLAGTRGGHEFGASAPLELKGIRDPLVAWEVTWSPESADPTAVPIRLAEASARGRCVGRDSELQVLIDAWKSAIAGERRLVLVAGEPGIGKTRLAAEVASRVVEHGGVALHGWCDEDMSAAFEPWARAVGSFTRALSDEDLASFFREGAADLSHLVPEIARRVPGGLAVDGHDPETERARVVDAIDLMIERASEQRPMLIVLDDLHWADRPTLSLLLRVLRSDRPGALLVVGTYRDTDVDRRHPLADTIGDLRREPRAARVSLDGLDETGLAALLADRAGHDAPEAFVRLLREGTDGNPFFIEEVLAHLVETGAIVHRDGVWTTDLAPGEIGLPEGVRDVVGRRLSRLSEDVNEMLTVAAVVGREFDLTTVVAAGGYARDVALDHMDAALATGLVTEVSGYAGRFAFSHALVRQTLEEEIGGPRRARLHWRVGEALRNRRDPPLAALAFHLCEGVLAGEPEIAAAAAVDAADESWTVGAPEEGRMLARRALEVLDDADVVRPDLECRAQLVISAASAMAQNDYPSGRQAALRAAEIARANGFADLAARAAIAYNRLFVPGAIDNVADELARAALELGEADHEWRPALIEFLGARHMMDGNWDAGLPLVEEARALAQGATPQVQTPTLVGRSTFYWGWPDLDIGLASALEALEAAERGASTYGLMGARMSLGVYALRRGDRAGFQAQHSAMRDLADKRSTTLWMNTLWAGTEALMDARLEDAQQYANDLISGISADSGYFISATAQLAATWYWSGADQEMLDALALFSVDQPGMRATLEAVRASTRARRGDEEAREIFERLAAEDFTDLVHDFNRPGCLCHLANATLWLADVRRASLLDPLLAEYDNQMLVAGQACLVYDSADALRGALAYLRGDHDLAVKLGERAGELCDQLGCIPAAVKNDHQLATSLAARNQPGDHDRARTLARSALERATALGLQPDVRFASDVLERLG